MPWVEKEDRRCVTPRGNKCGWREGEGEHANQEIKRNFRPNYGMMKRKAPGRKRKRGGVGSQTGRVKKKTQMK